MTTGLQVFDAAGRLIDDVTSQFSRIVGSVDIPPQNPMAITSYSGSFAVPEFSGGTHFFFFTTIAAPVAGDIRFYPNVTVSGNTLTWAYQMLDSEFNRIMVSEAYGVVGGLRLFYGVYS